MTTRTLPPLLPCPFCGCAPHTIERPDNIDGTEFFFAVACYCDGHSATAHKMAKRNTAEQAKADASSAWNTRSATATLLERIAELEAGLEARIQGCEAMSATIAILERKLAQQDAQPVQKECWCAACDMAKNVLQTKMCVCPECGDKRCAKAMRHDAACSAAPAKVSESKPVIYSDEYGAQPAQQDAQPVHQFRKERCSDWYDGFPDHADGHGPYESRTLYTHHAPKQVPLTDERMDDVLRGAGVVATFEALRCVGRAVESAHRITGDKP